MPQIDVTKRRRIGSSPVTYQPQTPDFVIGVGQSAQIRGLFAEIRVLPQADAPKKAPDWLSPVICPPQTPDFVIAFGRNAQIPCLFA